MTKMKNNRLANCMVDYLRIGALLQVIRGSQQIKVPFRGWLKTPAFRRSEGLSCRPFDSAQGKLRPASIFACAARPKKTWIPAYAGMTTRKKSRRLVDEFRTPRLVAEGRSVFIKQLCRLLFVTRNSRLFFSLARCCSRHRADSNAAMFRESSINSNNDRGGLRRCCAFSDLGSTAQVAGAALF